MSTSSIAHDRVHCPRCGDRIGLVADQRIVCASCGWTLPAVSELTQVLEQVERVEADVEVRVQRSTDRILRSRANCDSDFELRSLRDEALELSRKTLARCRSTGN